jgi:hypothetical protein
MLHDVATMFDELKVLADHHAKLQPAVAATRGQVR